MSHLSKSELLRQIRAEGLDEGGALDDFEIADDERAAPDALSLTFEMGLVRSTLIFLLANLEAF